MDRRPSQGGLIPPSSFVFHPSPASRRGVILVLVLWLLLIVSLIGLSYSSSVRTGVTITGYRANKVKARYYARAGIERTIAELLLREDSFYSESEITGFYDDVELFAQQPIGRGFFSLVTGRKNEAGEPIYGITDEASRLNLNEVTEEALLTFPEITEEMIDSLLDWRDEDWDQNIEGAEDDYYAMLEDPYLCKNANLQTVTELLLVRGWTTVELFGEDANNNGLLDRNENDADESPPDDDADGELDFGLVSFFTIYSRDKEMNPEGETRLDLNSATEEQLQQIEGIDQTQARSIVAWRGQNRFDSLADLFDVTEAQQQSQQQGSQRGSAQQPGTRSSRGSSGSSSQERSGSSSQSGQQGSSASSRQPRRVFDYDQVAQIVDWLCISTEDKANRINVNTAPFEVLMTLPEMTEELATEIITRRESSLGPFTLRLELRDVNGMTEEIFRGLLDYVTVQSYLFRIIAEGYEGETQAVIEAVIDVGDETPKILYWRES